MLAQSSLQLQLQCALVVFFILAAVSEGQTCPQTVISDTQINCTKFSTSRGQLGVNGIQLVDQYGNRVQLRGISSNGLHSPECVTYSALSFLVGNWGINVFRAVVYVDEWYDGYKVNAAAYDEYIVNVVQWCKELGIYVIIDWHVIGDPNAHMDAWFQPTSGFALDFFANYSALFKDETHVLYEIANEPTDLNWENLVWYHNIIIDAIRANSAHAVIIAGTPEFSQELHDAFRTRVDNPHNVLYSFHFHAGVDADLLAYFAEYALKMPLFVSQWGISSDTDGSSGKYNVSTAEAYLNVCASVGEEDDDASRDVSTDVVVSWTQWSWTDMDETPASLLLPNSCSSSRWWRTSCPGKYTENYFKSRAYNADSLDCDRVVVIPASNSGDDGALSVGMIFLIIFLVAGLALTAFYFYTARQTMLTNRANEKALKDNFPTTKLGQVEFKAIQGSEETPPPEVDVDSDIDLTNIYTSSEGSKPYTQKDSGLEDSEQMDFTLKDPNATADSPRRSPAVSPSRPVENNEDQSLVLPPPPAAISSQYRSSPPQSSFSSQSSSSSSQSSSSSSTLKRQPSRQQSSRAKTPSPPRRQHSALILPSSPPPGTVQHTNTLRSNYKKPTRNTRSIKNNLR